MSHPQAKIHRMFELVEPVAAISFGTRVLQDFEALGMRNVWDGYFAGRAAPLGEVPAEVVHSVFYNFAPGEVARHIPWVWSRTTPQEAHAFRERSSVAALQDRLGDDVESAVLARVADLAVTAAVSASTEGRILYAALRALEVPTDPLARLWHAATLLREYRGDGHTSVLVAHGIGGTQAHVLFALALGETPQQFGRTGHLPAAQLEAVVESLRRRGLVDADGGFTATGRALRERMEQLTDELAAPTFEVLTGSELDDLISGLERIVAAM